jgi:serine/threonine protein kinase
VTRASSLDNWLVGKFIAGKYRLREIQASGYFGTVFKAIQFFGKEPVRPVAVKISRQTGLTPETAPHLFGDALILARLLAGTDHPGKRHLVQIHDMGLLEDIDNRGFLVMEYVDGLPLLSHLRAAGRLSVASGLRYVKEICHALALVHGQGAIHRDLKSDNILLDRRGVVRVVDFGLAAFVNPDLGFVPGSMGTFTYMAPETLFGRSTTASDVYGLGLLLYELFTGGGPHLDAPWDVDDSRDQREEHLRLKQGLKFAPPSEAHNEIRFDYRWLDPLILRCLEIDPRRRFRDAAQMLAAIEICEAGGELPPIEESEATAGEGEQEREVSRTAGETTPAVEDEQLIREARRLLAGRAFDQVIDRLDIYRPAEWQTLDPRGGRILRVLGQAYLGRGDLATARDCLEQLRAAQRERAVLGRQDYAAALSDLVKCYRGLQQPELADACQEEARKLMREGR